MGININNESFANAYKCLSDANNMLKDGLGDFLDLDVNALKSINEDGAASDSYTREKDIKEDCFDLRDKMRKTIEKLSKHDTETRNYFNERLGDLLNYSDEDTSDVDWHDVLESYNDNFNDMDLPYVDDPYAMTTITSMFWSGVDVFENIGDAFLMYGGAVAASQTYIDANMNAWGPSYEETLKKAEEDAERIKDVTARAVSYDVTGAGYDKTVDAMGIDDEIAYGTAHTVGSVAGQVLGNLALGAVGGNGAQAIIGGAQAYGSTSEAALNSGASFDEANLAGMGAGVAGAAAGYGIDVLADTAKTVDSVGDAILYTGAAVGLGAGEAVVAKGVEYQTYAKDMVDENGNKLYDSYGEYYEETGGKTQSIVGGVTAGVRVGGASLNGGSDVDVEFKDSGDMDVKPSAKPTVEVDSSPKGVFEADADVKKVDTGGSVPTQDAPKTKSPSAPTTKNVPDQPKVDPVTFDDSVRGGNADVEFKDSGDMDIKPSAKPTVEVDSSPKGAFEADADVKKVDTDDFDPVRDVPKSDSPDTSTTKYVYNDLTEDINKVTEQPKVKTEPVILGYAETGDNVGIDFGSKSDVLKTNSSDAPATKTVVGDDGFSPTKDAPTTKTVVGDDGASPTKDAPTTKTVVGDDGASPTKDASTTKTVVGDDGANPTKDAPTTKTVVGDDGSSPTKDASTTKTVVGDDGSSPTKDASTTKTVVGDDGASPTKDASTTKTVVGDDGSSPTKDAPTTKTVVGDDGSSPIKDAPPADYHNNRSDPSFNKCEDEYVKAVIKKKTDDDVWNTACKEYADDYPGLKLGDADAATQKKYKDIVKANFDPDVLKRKEIEYENIARNSVDEIIRLQDNGHIKPGYSAEDVLRMIESDVPQEVYLTEEYVDAWRKKFGPVDSNGNVNVYLFQDASRSYALNEGVIGPKNKNSSATNPAGNGGAFVMCEEQFNKLLKNEPILDSNGKVINPKPIFNDKGELIDSQELKRVLGGVNITGDLVVVKQVVPVSSLELPRGSNQGAYFGDWRPGGTTSSGLTEAVVPQNFTSTSTEGTKLPGTDVDVSTIPNKTNKKL